MLQISSWSASHWVLGRKTSLPVYPGAVTHPSTMASNGRLIRPSKLTGGGGSSAVARDFPANSFDHDIPSGIGRRPWSDQPGRGGNRARQADPRPPRSRPRLIHRGLRHRRLEGREGAAGRAEIGRISVAGESRLWVKTGPTRAGQIMPVVGESGSSRLEGPELGVHRTKCRRPP